MTTITLRRGTAAAWTTANPILANGEAGLETDTGKLKFGNGVSTWNVLGYFNPQHTHAAADITSGEFDPLRLPRASGGNQGVISATEWSKLNNTHAMQRAYPAPTDPPSEYGSGISWHTVDGQTGWPWAYATVMTLRADGLNPRGFQTLIAKDTASGHARTWTRVETDGNAWTPWFAIREDDIGRSVTFQNSWTNFNSTSYQNLRTARTTGDLCSLAGMPKPGTIVDGVAIAYVNSAHIPFRDAYFTTIARTTVPSNVAVMGAIRGQNATFPGRVEIFGMPSTTSYLAIGATYHLGG